MDDRKNLPSASFMPVLVRCPGALAACQALPPEPPNKASEFGDQVHEMAALELQDAGATERVSYMHNEAKKIQDKLVSEIFGGYDGLMIWAETRFFAYDKQNQPRFSGRADKVLAKNGVILITDIKALPGEVESADANFQIGTLAVCIADDDSTRGPHVVNEILGAIVQPSVTKTPIVVRYTLEQLITLKRQLLQAIDAAMLPDAPRWPGKHCKYCRARAHCPQAASLPILWTSPELAVANLNPTQVADLYSKLSTVESIIEAIRDRAKELAATDPTFPYELKDRAGKMRITDLKAARELLSKFVGKDDFNALINVAIGPLRELFVTAYAGQEKTTKVEAGRVFVELLADVSERGEGYKVLAKKAE